MRMGRPLHVDKQQLYLGSQQSLMDVRGPFGVALTKGRVAFPQVTESMSGPVNLFALPEGSSCSGLSPPLLSSGIDYRTESLAMHCSPTNSFPILLLYDSILDGRLQLNL